MKPVVQRVLDVDGLSTRLDGKLIVDSVSLSVDRGEVVGVGGSAISPGDDVVGLEPIS